MNWTITGFGVPSLRSRMIRLGSIAFVSYSSPYPISGFDRLFTIWEFLMENYYRSYCREPRSELTVISLKGIDPSLKYPVIVYNHSNMCMYSELRRFPILHNAWSLAIKYWLRLCTGTGSILLNNAYRLAMEENHMWVPNIQYSLSSNDLGDIWICPENANAQFHKLFRLRLNDQFIQRWYNFINTSSRFVTLRELSDDFKLPVYINVIKNPSKRLLFTRLRIDINVLSTPRGS